MRPNRSSRIGRDSRQVKRRKKQRCNQPPAPGHSSAGQAKPSTK
jgi:hypothetical protein